MDLRTLTALTEPSDWKFKPLEELDQLLRCPICFEYFRTAMMFPQCSHNFCSLCIRRYLSATSSKCPMCAAAVVEGDLKNNRLLDQLTDQFTRNRGCLLSLVQRAERGQGGGGGGGEKRGRGGREGGGGRWEESDLIQTLDNKCCEGIDRQKGGRRLYSVPEAPDLPDSEAFIGKITTTSDDGCALLQEEGERGNTGEEEMERGEGNGKGVKRMKNELLDAESKEMMSPSVLLPRQPKYESLWEGESKRTRLFGDLCEAGESGESCGGREMTRLQTPSASTSSQSVPPPPPPPPHCSPHPSSFSSTSVSHAHNSSVSSLIVEDSPSINKVECPVCGLLFQSRVINRHLDTVCLKKPTNDITTRPRYSKVPRLVYQIMKDKQLKSKLKEYHLSTHGDRQMLISRLKEFILRFNSQCDSLSPRSPREIAVEVERDEKLRQTNRPSHQSPAVRSRRGSTADELEKREYEETHKDHFARLIVQARGRGEKEVKDELEKLVPGTPHQPSVTSDDSDWTDDRPVVLAGASPDRTPLLTSRRSRETSVIIPESPQSRPKRSKKKRRRLVTPPPRHPPPSSPPPPDTSWEMREDGEEGEGSDPEFVPTPSHYRTPASRPSSGSASKRQRR